MDFKEANYRFKSIGKFRLFKDICAMVEVFIDKLNSEWYTKVEKNKFINVDNKFVVRNNDSTVDVITYNYNGKPFGFTLSG